MSRILALSLLIAAIAFAQTGKRPRKPAAAKPAVAKTVPADPSQAFPLESIRVEGNRLFATEGILQMSGLRPGQMVSRQEFDAAQKRLLDSGLFETVAYRYDPVPQAKGYRAMIEVKEVNQVFPYRFDAVDVPEKDLREWLKQQQPLFGDRIPATEPVLKRFRESVAEYLAKKDKPLPISGRLMPNAKGDLEVVFQPSSLPAIAQVNFRGNKALSGPALQQGISGAAVGALYTENRFRQILDASVRPLYEQQGYLRVSFPRVETMPASDVRGLVANVEVSEGAVYKLRDVKLAGEMAENKRLLKEGAFRTDEVVDMKAVGEGAKRIERSLRRIGFLNAAASIERTLHDKEKVVDVVINVDPGPQYRMGKLDFAGLDITTEPQIRKMWALKEKSPFDFEYPDIFLSEMPNVLDNLGRTRPVLKPDAGTLTVDVLLTFSPPEKKPGDRHKRPDNTRPNSVEFP